MRMVFRDMVGTMAFEYAWLKILQTLEASKRALSLEELRINLGRYGFRFDGTRLEDALARLQDQELVQILVFAGGGHSSVASVAITPKGERKVRGIVRF